MTQHVRCDPIAMEGSQDALYVAGVPAPEPASCLLDRVTDAFAQLGLGRTGQRSCSIPDPPEGKPGDGSPRSTERRALPTDRHPALAARRPHKGAETTC
jgi:hypothetical protein